MCAYSRPWFGVRMYICASGFCERVWLNVRECMYMCAYVRICTHMYVHPLLRVHPYMCVYVFVRTRLLSSFGKAMGGA